VLERTPRSAEPRTWRREEILSTKKWNETFGKPDWPTVMRSDRFPFLAALDYPDLDETTLPPSPATSTPSTWTSARRRTRASFSCGSGNGGCGQSVR
jgi:hypothetical protein